METRQTGGHRESGETGESGEEGDTQWRQGRLGDIGSQGRQGVQGKRGTPNGDKLSLYALEYSERFLIHHISGHLHKVATIEILLNLL